MGGTLLVIMNFKNEETEELFASGNFSPLDSGQRNGVRILHTLQASGQLNSL